MRSYGIGITCVQEVWKYSNEYFITPEGFLCIFSGSDKVDANDSRAGVGFIIAPEVRASVIGFS